MYRLHVRSYTLASQSLFSHYQNMITCQSLSGLLRCLFYMETDHQASTEQRNENVLAAVPTVKEQMVKKKSQKLKHLLNVNNINNNNIFKACLYI